jgi:hypothetical protein
MLPDAFNSPDHHFAGAGKVTILGKIETNDKKQTQEHTEDIVCQVK